LFHHAGQVNPSEAAPLVAPHSWIPADIRDTIKGTHLDRGVYLDWIKGMEPDRAPLSAP